MRSPWGVFFRSCLRRSLAALLSVLMHCLKPDLGFSAGHLSTRASSSSLPSFSDPTATLYGLVGVHVHGAWPTRVRKFCLPGRCARVTSHLLGLGGWCSVVHGGCLWRGDLQSRHVSPTRSRWWLKSSMFGRIYVGFFYRVISSLVFLRFFQSLPIIFADIMDLFFRAC
jgi:hypothetical protein